MSKGLAVNMNLAHPPALVYYMIAAFTFSLDGEVAFCIRPRTISSLRVQPVYLCYAPTELHPSRLLCTDFIQVHISLFYSCLFLWYFSLTLVLYYVFCVVSAVSLHWSAHSHEYIIRLSHNLTALSKCKITPFKHHLPLLFTAVEQTLLLTPKYPSFDLCFYFS